MLAKYTLGIISIILLFGNSEPAHSQPLASCHGTRLPMVVTRQMPYVSVKVGNASGYFLVDHGTNTSSIDTSGFQGPTPKPNPGTTNTFSGFDFFGTWGPVVLQVQNQSGIQGLSVRQAGIVGTDFLALNAFTLDYRGGGLYRAAPGSLCSDSVLQAEGFRPVWTLGYFPTDLNRMNPSFPRIPTVPIRIGGVAAIAQLDPGFDDTFYPHSVNINRAFHQVLTAAGIQLLPVPPVPGVQQTLTTCVGVPESVTTFRLPDGVRFEIVGTDGSAVISAPDAVIHVKDTPLAAKSCGGIGTWSMPAAQVAASFFVEAGRMVFDPHSERVWFGR